MLCGNSDWICSNISSDSWCIVDTDHRNSIYVISDKGKEVWYGNADGNSEWPFDGKLTPELILNELRKHEDHHMVKPKMVYISNTTEIGTVYTKKELENISKVCKDNNLYLYLDGARLASALTSEKCDINLEDYPRYCDVF